MFLSKRKTKLFLSVVLLLTGYLIPVSSILPRSPDAPTFAQGPDLIAGDLPALQQFGSGGTQVGLALATTSCNNGDQQVNWFQFGSTNHPFVPQNLYRMSGGSSNTDRFEQIGQSWLKHGVEAVQEDACGFGCIPAGDIHHLGVGCSDPYLGAQNAGQSGLGSRAWANPFTGTFPSTASDHTGHTHSGTSHRLLVEGSDLNTATNVGATYYAEAQYITADEYNWCQSHPGQCNMYNNASYRRFNVTGTASPFSFAPVGSTVRMTPAINAWTGATISPIEPVPGVDGRAFIGYKVTNPSTGVWHYEYALYNQNLDRGIQSFSVPLGCGITVSNPGFHAPPNHPGFANDGTVGNAGFSNAAWTPNQTAGALSWSSETFAQNQNANALRFATLYNFRFDSNRPPQVVNATIGFFKTGAPITIGIQAPTPDSCNPPTPSQVVSRKSQGMTGSFDVNLPLTGNAGIECRSGGGSNDYQVVLNFPNPVTFTSAQITTGQGIVTSATGSGTIAITVNLTGVTNAQTITVTLFNVSDNTSAGDLQVQMAILIGDTSGNGTVNASDISQTKSKSGQALDSSNFRQDVTVSGAINASDVDLVKLKSGTGLSQSLPLQSR